jgi:hypothetical protein
MHKHTTTPRRIWRDMTHYDRRGVAVLPTGFKSALFFLPHFGCPACDGSGRGCLVNWRKEVRH